MVVREVDTETAVGTAVSVSEAPPGLIAEEVETEREVEGARVVKTVAPVEAAPLVETETARMATVVLEAPWAPRAPLCHCMGIYELVCISLREICTH